MNEQELIETIKKVSLEKDDILIFQLPQELLSDYFVDHLRCIMDEALPEQTRYLILPKEMDINILSLKDLIKGEMNEQ